MKNYVKLIFPAAVITTLCACSYNKSAVVARSSLVHETIAINTQDSFIGHAARLSRESNTIAFEERQYFIVEQYVSAAGYRCFRAALTPGNTSSEDARFCESGAQLRYVKPLHYARKGATL